MSVRTEERERGDALTSYDLPRARVIEHQIDLDTNHKFNEARTIIYFTNNEGHNILRVHETAAAYLSIEP